MWMLILMPFKKNRIMPAPGFFFILPHLIYIYIHILLRIQHANTSFILDTSPAYSYTSSFNVGCWRDDEIEEQTQFSLYALISGAQMPKLQYDLTLDSHHIMGLYYHILLNRDFVGTRKCFSLSYRLYPDRRKLHYLLRKVYFY